VAAVVAPGCAAISGLDSLDVVDCVSGDCSDAGRDGRGNGEDGPVAADGGSEASDATLDVAEGSSPAESGADGRPELDALEDARPDSGPDATADSGPDATADASPDAMADSGPDATVDAGSDAAEDAGEVDSGSDAGSDSGSKEDASGVDAACPGTGGPPAVRVDAGFCVDSTEVTVSEYEVFLDAGVAIGAQPAVCAWNSSYAPSFKTGTADEPIDYVNWCDAYAFCKWAGKRLCGAIGGGPTPFGSYASASSSQWFNACSQDGAFVYPYGNAYQGVCVDKAHDSTIQNVGSSAGCVGGYPGLFDMSGNVWEWEDSCSGDAGTTDVCRYRGGSYQDTSASGNLECASDSTSTGLTRNASRYEIGIRCCGP
jgi:formylglycine-generating enzyme required for sulfatase activity